MRTYLRLTTICTILCSLTFTAAADSEPFSSPAKGTKFGDFANPLQLLIAFEQNRGQSDAQVRFIGRSASGTVFLTDDGLTLSGGTGDDARSVRLRLLGAQKTAPAGEAATGGVVNYYRTREPKNWLTKIPLFSRVRYRNVYSGIDAIFHGHNGELEYDFEIAPGSSPESIAIAIEGAEAMAIAADGSLEIHAGKQTWRLMPPAAYQLKSGARQQVAAEYQITKPGIFKLEVASYDRTVPLVIDPVVEYAKVIGLNNRTDVDGMGVDGSGNLYIAGTTSASDYPVVNGQPGKFPAGSTQVYLTKLDPTGNTILFSTYIPCSGFSRLDALRVDAAGNAYLIGEPGGSDYPVTTTALGTSGGFLTKFATDGTMAYSSILGGAFPRGLRVDGVGNAYVVGEAGATLQTTANAFQAAPPCATCGAKFFAKVDPTGTAYVFASYFYDPAAATLIGASAGVNPGIALDASGNIYLFGQATEAPRLGAWQIGGGLFLAKFSPDGQTLQFSTDFGGGSGGETPLGIEVGNDGTVFIVGSTGVNDYPYAINAAGHPLMEDSGHIFATAINPALNGLTYSTYVADGSANGIFLDSNNDLYITGSATRTLPLQNAVVSDINHSATGFLAELDPAGNPVKVSRFGGHLTDEIPTAITSDGAGNIFIAGGLSPQNEIPQPDPILAGPRLSAGLTGGNYGAFFAEISPASLPEISLNTAVLPFLFLRNAGSADLHISSMTFSAGRTWGNCGAVVPAGSSCVVTVSDNSGRLAGGTLTIISDAQPGVQTFNLSLAPGQRPGTPIGDFLWFDDDRQILPPRLQQTVPFHIWNVGTAGSVINLITGGPGTSQTNDCGTGLAPDAGCTVQFTWPGGGADLRVFFDDSAFKDFLLFSPQVSQDPILSTAGIIFPTQFVGGVSLPRTVTVTNTGESDISVSTLLTGDPEFTIGGTTCQLLLPAHQSCVVGVLFTPVIDGKRNAVLTIDGSTAWLFAWGEINSAVQVSPLQQDFFPTVVHLASETFPITLTNTLAAPVPISGITFSLADYTETDNCAGQVPANGSCTVRVTFTPQAVGARNGTMTVSFTGATTQVLTLTGEGETPFRVAPSSLNFSAAVGATSPQQGISIGNRLSTQEGYTFTVTGAFVIVQNPCANPLPPNGANNSGCAPTIGFQPTVAGPAQGTFTVSYAGITEQDVVTLNGIASTVSASPLQLNFPLTKIPTSSTLDVTLTNSGASAVGITSISTAIPYSEADTCQGTVPANGTCVLHVSFTPRTTTFPVTGTLTIALADGAQYSVSLSGTGTGPVISILAISGTTFADQVAGTTSRNPLTVSVFNNGDAPLNITGISITGDFSQTNNCPASLVSTCQITVKFTPTAVGLRTGVLTLSDDGFGNPQTLQFSGTGNDFQVSVAGAGASATVIAGQTATYNLSFSAVGSFSGQIFVECSGAPQQAMCALSAPDVNLIGSVPVPLTVTVKTSPHTSATTARPAQFLAGINLLAGLLLLPVALISKRVRKSVAARSALLVTVLAALLLVTSCGGGGGGGSQPTPAPPPALTQGGTPAGTYSLTITSTDQTINGPVVRQTNLTLVVQ